MQSPGFETFHLDTPVNGVSSVKITITSTWSMYWNGFIEVEFYTLTAGSSSTVAGCDAEAGMLKMQ